PLALNERGDIVGWSRTASGAVHAFLWTERDGMRDLGTGDGLGSVAVAVGEDGSIVGRTASLASPVPADGRILRRPAGPFLVVPPNSLGERRGARGGLLEGVPVAREYRAAAWFSGRGPRGLGALGGSAGTANAVGPAGHVVGLAETRPGQMHAFVWTPGRGMMDLGTLGGDGSGAVAVNETGQIVGWSRTASGRTHAVLWELR
ncbi:MAG: hypothetical protein ACE5HP_09860, partial [Gemmatimonadota bacterium]